MHISGGHTSCFAGRCPAGANNRLRAHWPPVNQGLHFGLPRRICGQKVFCVGLLSLRSNNVECNASASALIQTKSRGYLKVPSRRLLALLKIVEEHVETYTVQKIACGDVYTRIVESILLDSRTASASVGCVSHFLGTTAEVVHFFLRCRLHFFTREKNKASRATVRGSCPASGGRKPQC